MVATENDSTTQQQQQKQQQATTSSREDNTEAENIKIITCSEPCNEPHPATLLCTSTIQSEAADPQRSVSCDVTNKSWHDNREISDSNIIAANTKRNSCTISQDRHEMVEHKPTWLANQLGRRLTAPIIKANIKRCHKKLAALQLPHFCHQYQQPPKNFLKYEENPLALKLLNSSSNMEIYNQDFEHKPLIKNLQTTTTTPAESSSHMDKCKKSPEKGANGLRQARRRKRLSFLRRSTKSAPD